MKKKRIGIVAIILVLLVAVGIVGYYYFIRENKDSTLTVAENQWIENNKNDMIDVSVITQIPVFSMDGEGVIFDFLKSIEDKTGLSFNQLSYNMDGNAESDYAFEIKDKKDKNDIVIYQDNYVIVTKGMEKYTNLEDIQKMALGTLEKDLENASRYLKVNRGFSFKPYKSLETLNKALKRNDVDGIILPKILYLNTIGNTSNFHINYNITEMNNYIVLRLGNDKKLNTIIKKYHKKWQEESYKDSYHKNFSNYYFEKNEIYENAQVEFRSKQYTYGFIPNPPFDALNNEKLVGINSDLLRGFAQLADIEISYNEYKNISDLKQAFDESKIDIFMDFSDGKRYNLDLFETVDVYEPQAYIISHINNDIIVNSLSSLIGKNVMTIKDSKILSSLNGYDINIKTYNNIEHLLTKLEKDSVIVLDKKNYETYMSDHFKDYKIDYMYRLNKGYNFIIRDTKENEVFEKYFNFYLSYINEKELKADLALFKNPVKNRMLLYGFGFILLLAIGMIVLIIHNNRKKQSKLKDIPKEDKIRYIDDLTSLKNRRYLNDTMKVWDEGEIYPQAIVIVDLNNIAYINDNYGHEEGDKTIVEAANILITSQLENSEIIRTDGNEFLVYLVEYDEKQVISYIRKLNKELKDLSHGFGSAIGYSMIVDEIKTIDDAINEATLDMKSNKEES